MHMRTTLRPSSLLLIAIVLAWLPGGCSKSAKETEPVTTVQVEPAKKGPITEVVTADAVIYPLEQAALAPKLTAPVKQFYVHPGSHVRTGQLLATLENKDLAATAMDNQGQYAQAQATYETATASSIPEEVQKAQLDVSTARETLDAQQKLYNSREDLFKQGALPRKDLDQAAVALVQAKSQYEISLRHLQSVEKVNRQQEVKAANGQLASAKGKYLNAEAQLSYSEIRSPINGIITQRNLYVGEVAQAGTPFITVVNNSQIVARAHVPQNEAVLLKVGNPGKITVTGVGDVQGKVTFVNAATDPNSTTIEVWMQAPNRGGAIKPGLTGNISIEARTVKDAILVPANALQPDPDGGFAVMVAGSDDKAHQKKVTVGIRNGNDAQISSGLNEGEQVIVSGGYGLTDNAEIKVASEKPDASGSSDEKGAAKGDNGAAKTADKAKGASQPEKD